MATPLGDNTEFLKGVVAGQEVRLNAQSKNIRFLQQTLVAIHYIMGDAKTLQEARKRVNAQINLTERKKTLS